MVLANVEAYTTNKSGDAAEKIMKFPIILKEIKFYNTSRIFWNVYKILCKNIKHPNCLSEEKFKNSMTQNLTPVPWLRETIYYKNDNGRFWRGCWCCTQSRNAAYDSRTLKDSTPRFSTIEKETLGIIWVFIYFETYLLETPFTTYTDHGPSVWLFNVIEPNLK